MSGIEKLKEFMRRHPRIKRRLINLPFAAGLIGKMKRRDPEIINVRELIQSVDLHRHAAKADAYFAGLSSHNYHLSKPFASVDEAPDLIILLGNVLQGLRLFPGARVLDFGAGTCWTSRYLSQLGCRVFALDVSPAALDIGRELYRRRPVIGEQPAAEFLVFDGEHIPLADGSIDRILCFDAFHHLPNPDRVLAEMRRVLGQGGIAGFSEPGPDHSLAPQSQYEMKTHGVIENDIDLRTIWKQASAAGFTDIKAAVFSLRPMLFSLPAFESFLSGWSCRRAFNQVLRYQMKDRRMFFLFKGEASPMDSRTRASLRGRISVAADQTAAKAGGSLKAVVTAVNTGEAVWLPPGSGTGEVNLGVHLYDAPTGRLINADYFRALLTSPARPVAPGETVMLNVAVPSPGTGRFMLEFDLVAEGVCWFAMNGSSPARLEAEFAAGE